MRRLAAVAPDTPRERALWTAPRLAAPVAVDAGFFTVLALWGAGQAATSRHAINADGVAYLDIADEIARGHLGAALHAYWSPLYPFLLALARGIDPSPRAEYPIAHALNLAILLFAAAAFRLLVRELVRARRRLYRTETSASWIAVAYAAFLWAALELATVRTVSPDLLLFAFAVLAAALLVRVFNGRARPATLLGLGLVLGVGYLAKAPLFPIGLAYVAAVPLLARRRRLAAAGIALSGFLAIAGPWIVALSLRTGRLTFGESGRLNYAWYVDRTPWRHWQGEGAHGTPIHATRRLSTDPPAYEFGSPVFGTYPAWDDPSYWFAGLRVRFDTGRQLHETRAVLGTLYRMLLDLDARRLLARGEARYLFSPLLLLAAGALLLASPCASLRALLRLGPLLLPSAAAFALYSAVYAEERHVAPFWLLGAVTLLAAAAPPRAPRRGRVALAVSAGVLGAFAAIVAPDLANELPWGPPSPEPRERRIADELLGVGVTRGSRLAILEYANLDTGWARLARVRFVAEVYADAHADNARLFWDAPPEKREALLSALARSGAEFAVSRPPPGLVFAPGWTRLRSERLWVRRLSGNQGIQGIYGTRRGPSPEGERSDATPAAVSGWSKSLSRTENGRAATSAPIAAASRTWIGFWIPCTTIWVWSP
jgi:hypothetical protein